MSEQLSAIYATIDFVESHLRDDVSVADIAVAAGYSLYHFIRTFNQTVHHTPYDYLMRRRLSESAKELITTQRRILDIALDYCFNNPETFSRAFKRMFGVQPSQWRSHGVIPYRSLLSPLTLDYLEHINHGGISQLQVIERETTCLAGLMSQGTDNIPGLWQNLRQILGAYSPLGEPYAAYGVHTVLQNKDSIYFAGVETASPESTIPPLVTLTIPPGSYVQFIHKSGEDTRIFSLDYVYHTWLPKFKTKLRFPKYILKDSVIDSTTKTELKQTIEVEHCGDQFPSEQNPVQQWMMSILLNN